MAHILAAIFGETPQTSGIANALLELGVDSAPVIFHAFV